MNSGRSLQEHLKLYNIPNEHIYYISLAIMKLNNGQLTANTYVTLPGDTASNKQSYTIECLINKYNLEFYVSYGR